jgi:NAD(P)-dependent dehydrogenase (short-subunit alcohol dehydrogenase family)
LARLQTELVSKGFAVVLVARNAAKADAVKAEIRAATGGEVEIILADLTSLKTVYQLAETFKRRYPGLDVLINNAVVFMTKGVLSAATVLEAGLEEMTAGGKVVVVVLLNGRDEEPALSKSRTGALKQYDSSFARMGSLSASLGQVYVAKLWYVPLLSM